MLGIVQGPGLKVKVTVAIFRKTANVFYVLTNQNNRNKNSVIWYCLLMFVAGYFKAYKQLARNLWCLYWGKARISRSG